MTIDAALREIAGASEALALVTVAKVSGSVPRGAGSRMALRRDGSIVGTVGGGLPEARAKERALACLAEGRGSTLLVEMKGEVAAGPELICGGEAEIWIELVSDPAPWAAAVAAVDRGETVVIASSPAKGLVAVMDGGGRAIAGSAEGLDAAALADARRSGLPQLGNADGLLYSPIEPPERLLILGGGHVGLALARAAVALSFQVRVADPRPEFSAPSRFPLEVECVTAPFVEAIEAFPFGPSASVVIVSPGHLGDLECARAILRRDYRYAGLIGSRRKCRMLMAQLKAEGYPGDKVESLRAPIGLDIGAETPEEIAVAIAAELIAVRRSSASLGWIDEDRRRRRET
jgi:xanthine dehydrogenase accessory factor